MFSQGQGRHLSDSEGGIVALTSRVSTTILGLAGAGGAAIAGNFLDAAATRGVAWAGLAAIGLSLMLHGRGLRVLGVLLALLSVAGIVASIMEQPWIAVAFVALLVASALFVVVGPSWRTERAPRVQQRSLWEELDNGEDPTL